MSSSIFVRLSFAVFACALVACGSAPSEDAFNGGPSDASSGGDSANVDGSNDDTTSDDTSVADDTSPGIDTEPPPFDTIGGCPTGSTDPGGDCPSQCTGGCAGDLCRIACSTPNACDGETIECPSGKKCVVQCNGLSSCANTTVRCADSAPCALQCGAVSSCANVAFNCPRNAGCELACSATSSCSNLNVVCSDGACIAGCAGFPTGPVHVECGASCACDNKCI